MTEITRFRTAIGGFNRSDVANYIEQSAAEHREKVKAMETEIVKLQNELLDATKRLSEAEAQLAATHRDSEIVAQIRELLLDEE